MGGGEGEEESGYVLSFFLAGVTPLQALTYVRACVCACVRAWAGHFLQQ